MFDIGFGEMVLLAAIALVAVGPKQLPEVARTVGKLLGELKKAVGDVTSTVANAREETDRAIRKVTSDLTNVTDGINRDVSNVMNPTDPLGLDKDSADASSPVTPPLIQTDADAKPKVAAEPHVIIPLPDHLGDPAWEHHWDNAESPNFGKSRVEVHELLRAQTSQPPMPTQTSEQLPLTAVTTLEAAPVKPDVKPTGGEST